MFKLTKPALLSAALLAGGAAPVLAADLYEPPVVVTPPVALGGWYLRGHIGMSNQRLDRLDYEYFSDPEVFEWVDEGGFDSAPIFGVGFGYQFNHWLRADVTAEWRGKSDFHAADRYDETGDGIFDGTNDYRAKKSELLFLANAYADLGSFHGITPYVGAGIGASRNTISHFTDVNIGTGGGGYAGKESEWNFAWALHAGVGIKATERLTIDLGYSFVNLGDATTGQAYNNDPALSRDNDGFKFENLTSHDLKLGVRYGF
jgi:opacity protein-like surface antigen